MASTTANKNVLEKDMPEVFTRTPEQIGKETCDSCGVSVVARYSATNKAASSLSFCAHHTRRFAEKLKRDGFTISPERYDYDFTGE